jgi:hypothetical protein
MVVIPHEYIPWYNIQVAKGSIDIVQLNKERLHFKYSSLNADSLNPNILHLTRRVLSMNRESLLDIVSEVESDLERWLGDDSLGWTEVACFSLMGKVATASANKMIVGRPICGYLKHFKLVAVS